MRRWTAGCIALLAACAGDPWQTRPAPSGPQAREPCDQGRCAEGYSCRYVGEPPELRGICAVEVGRCGFDGDCHPGQRCQRLGPALGSCTEPVP